MAAGNIIIHLIGDADSLIEALEESDSALLNLTAFALEGAIVTFGDLAGVIGAVIDRFNDLFLVYDKQIQADVQLEAILKATGNAVGLTADEIRDYAKVLEQTISVSDQTTTKVAGLLSSFARFSGPEFRRAIDATFDMATVLGIDVQSAAIAVGKALAEPTRGVERLQRVGTTFTKTQKELILGFDELGLTAEAASGILDVLEQRFGGVAEAQAKTLGGELNQLFIRMTNLGEKIFDAFKPLADIILPVLDIMLLLFEQYELAVLKIVKAFTLLLKTFTVGIFNLDEMLDEWLEFFGVTVKTERKMKEILGVEKEITKEKRKQLDLFTPLESFAFGIERAAEQRRISDLEDGDADEKLVDLMEKQNKLILDGLAADRERDVSQTRRDQTAIELMEDARNIGPIL